MLNTEASPLLVNVTAVASGASRNHAVRSVNGAATIRHSVLRAVGDSGEYIGLRHMASSGNWVVRVDNSLIEGSGNAFFGDTEYTTYVAHSQFIGFVSANMGTIKCIGVYNETYDPISCD